MQRYLEGWSEIISFPNPFNLEHGRRVLAFSSSVEVQAEAMNAGAALAGGAALIKDVQVLTPFNFLHRGVYVISV